MCTCSSVYYCLMSACSYCQGGGLSSWSTYHAHCNDTDVSLASFPKSLPSGVSIPQWAFMDVTEKDILDIDLARSIAGEACEPRSESCNDRFVQLEFCPAENAVPTSSGSHRKPPSVAIVLGCIFAAVVLLASFGFNAYRVWKKKRGSLQQILGEDCVPYPISPPATPPPAKAGLRDSVIPNASWVGQLNAVHATRAKIRASTPSIDNFAINEVQRPQQQVAVNQIPPDYDPLSMQPPSYESLQEHGSGA
ncbi:hypothetical protein BJ165DRAFT_845985 [Panaeolus papilionaceus]|nr:hypothetical protein BJ165DRAFT_845985 [Panaeolus papilionaceus]